MKMNPGIFNRKTLAEYLGVHPDMVDRLRAKHGLPYIRMGEKIIRFRKSSVDAWLEDQERVISSDLSFQRPPAEAGEGIAR